jgi:amino acid transporter
MSEETKGAEHAAARGLWQAIFYSAIGGWIVLLAFLYAVQDADAVTAGGGGVAVIFAQALSAEWAGVVLLIASFGQLFCCTSALTSASRMMFAFSRDGAVPGSKKWSKVDKNKVPRNAVLACAAVAGLITLPALVEVNIGSADAPIVVPTAFYAVVSITVIGLYLAFLIPIYQRWRMGNKFRPGSWTLGNKYKWMSPIAVIEIIVISIYFIMPTTPMGWPGNEGFDIKFVNYAPILVGGTLLVLWIWWHLSVKKWFTGPKTTV